MEWVRFIIGGSCIVFGLIVACVATIGVYKFHFVLNRMHAAAMNDTLAILLVLLGLIVLNGLNFTSLKLFIIICFFWIASPVSAHLIAKLELTTDEGKCREECEVGDDVNL